MRKNILFLSAVFFFTLSSVACFSTREGEISINANQTPARSDATPSGQAGMEKSPEAEKTEQTEPEKNLKNDSPEKESDGKVENRCGWYSNPTPGNHWINDKDGEWIIGTQGGNQAEGDYPPEFSDDQWVKTNGYYGYGCACLRVIVDRKEKRIVKVISGNAKPLSACRNDPALSDPDE